MQYLTAIELTPGGSSTVHIYTQAIRRTTQLNIAVGANFSCHPRWRPWLDLIGYGRIYSVLLFQNMLSSRCVRMKHCLYWHLWSTVHAGQGALRSRYQHIPCCLWTKYRTGRYQDDHLSKIPTGPYTARGPSSVTPKEQTLPSNRAAAVENTILNTTEEKDCFLAPGTLTVTMVASWLFPCCQGAAAWSCVTYFFFFTPDPFPA